MMFKRIKFGEFHNVIEVRERNTDRNFRRANEYRVCKIRTEVGKRGIQYNGIKLWNELPIDLRECNNFKRFIKKAKRFLLGIQG